MSPITKEFTKEQLQQIIETDHVQCGEASSLARIALASLEAEAVHQVLTGDAWVDLSKGAMESQKRVGAIVRTVYTGPPAPVVVPDAYIRDGRGRMMLNGRQEPRIGYSAGWNACRAAMLQSFGNSEQLEPVTTTNKLPSGWVACSERMPHIGVPVITCCGDVVQYAAYAWDGKEWQDWYEEYDKLPANTFTHWHPRPVAPQQEISHALAKGMERYGDAMQELAQREMK